MSVFLMPSAPGTCQLCAVAHQPEQPHNAQSLPYQVRFKSTHGRFPTWADAVAHCPPEISAAWKEKLQEMGHWSEPIKGSPIAEVDRSGGEPRLIPLPSLKPVTVPIHNNNKRMRPAHQTTARRRK